MRADPRPPDLRVLILLEQSVPHRAWAELVPALRSHGVSPLIGSVCEAGEFQTQLGELGCPTFSLHSRNSRSYPGSAVRLAALVRRHRIEVLHGNEPIPAAICAVAGALARTPLRVFHRQHTAFPGNAKMTWLSRWAARHNDVVLAVSEAAARCCVELDGVSRTRVRVAHNGASDLRAVRDEEICAIRTRLGIPAGAAVVSVVARLNRVKGLDVLVEALPALQQALGARPVHLVIAGGGEEEASLVAAASSVAPGRVHFVGPQSDVAPWFYVGDVVAVPSRLEGMPVAGSEAMSCARALVASRVGGLAELVAEETTGLLVPSDDRGALARALARLLRDPALAEQMGAAGRRRFEERFTMRHTVAGWMRCYEEFLPDARAVASPSHEATRDVAGRAAPH